MKSENKNADPILEAAKKYYGLGLAIHWVLPATKCPAKGGWNSGVRDSWKTLSSEYRRGFGVGIRLGQASNVNEGFLSVIDMDVRSSNPIFLEQAKAAVDRYSPNLREIAPFVQTGRGFGSAHFYFVSDTLLSSKKIGRSSTMVKVFSPTSEISGEQKKFVTEGALTSRELQDGFRMKAAWEVDLMCSGKQVVAPPSVHPDTKKKYLWVRGLA